MPLTKQEWINLEAMVEVALTVAQGEPQTPDWKTIVIDLGNALRGIKKLRAEAEQ